ncbi:MAG TPA: hypothetical protein PK264_11525 [Hyphomicrobiaceae bacterium]|nr:hypothetical protein [Hyphomicrobiaceae bacterium]
MLRVVGRLACALALSTPVMTGQAALALDCGPLKHIEIELPSGEPSMIERLSDRLVKAQCAWSLKARASAPGRLAIAYGTGAEIDTLIESVLEDFLPGYSNRGYVTYPIGNSIRLFRLPEFGTTSTASTHLPQPAGGPVLLFSVGLRTNGQRIGIPKLNHLAATALARKGLRIWRYLDPNPDVSPATRVGADALQFVRSIPERPRLVVLTSAARAPATSPNGDPEALDLSAHLLDEVSGEWSQIWKASERISPVSECTSRIHECEAKFLMTTIWPKLEGAWADEIAGKLK